MSTFRDLWAEAGEEGWQPPEAGYYADIVDATAYESRDGRQFAKVVLRVAKGEHQGREWDHVMGFGSKVGARISRQSLVMYGVDPEAVKDFEDLQVQITRLVGTAVEVKVKHNNGYVNTDVIRSYTGESDVTPPGSQQKFQTAPAAAAADDDEVPF